MKAGQALRPAEPLFKKLGTTPAEEAAIATLRAVERGRNETTLTRQGKLLVFLSRFFPRLVDRIAARRVRQLFQDEIETRRRANHQTTPA